MGKNLKKPGIKTITLSSKMICNLLHSSLQCNNIFDAGVYCTSWKDCKFEYIVKMLRNFQKCWWEHKIENRVGNLNNALLQHISMSGHNFDFGAATMLAYIHNKRWR